MTSIEWLEEKAKEFAIDLDLLNYFEQAKEMHKQEIINAYEDGDSTGDSGSGVDYFNNTIMNTTRITS
jgi:hypothetical protein